MDRKRFLDNYEYLLRLKGWADRRLKVLGYEERNVKGVGIPELDGRKALDALFSSSSDYQMADDEELRSLINEINSRQGREIVFLGSLGYRFRLSVAEEICLFLAALPEFEGVYGKIFSWLNGNGKKTRPVMEVGARIMGLNQLVRNSIREELTENSTFARYMLDESWGKEQESFWDREVISVSYTHLKEIQRSSPDLPYWEEKYLQPKERQEKEKTGPPLYQLLWKQEWRLRGENSA